MITRTALAVIVASWVVLPGTTVGARERAPSVADIRHQVESSSTSCRLDVDEELTFGRTKLWFVRRLVAMVEDVDPQTRAILDGLRHVEVGSYRVRGENGDCPIPPDLEADLAGRGWNRTARWQDQSGRGIVLQRTDADDQIDAMLVLEIGNRTVEIVRIEGRIHDILFTAVQAHPGSTGSLLGVN